jgi:C_GCAxxG_C_C family probable redox protein
MKLREATQTYFVDGPYNCAEATLLIARDELGLPVDDAAVRALGAFGGGMGCGELCGAIAGACSAVGIALIEEGAARGYPDVRPASTAVANHFLEKYGSLRCADLKPHHYHPDTRCARLVEEAVDCLSEVLDLKST